MDKDLVDSLCDDIPRYAAINPRAVKREKIKALLETMNVNSITGFGAFFKYEQPFLKFARIYVDIHVFNVPVEQAFRINT